MEGPVLIAIGTACLLIAFLISRLHIHRWTKWTDCNITEQRWDGKSLELSGQRRRCTSCGKKEVRDALRG